MTLEMDQGFSHTLEGKVKMSEFGCERKCTGFARD